MSNELARLLVEVCGLKREPRRGWIDHGVDPTITESVADHSFGTALMVLFLAHERAADIDLARALSLAVVHDLAEVRTGDITPADGVEKDEKAKRERSALEAMVAGLPGREHWIGLFDEYQRGETAEARFVRACDKLEMAAQGRRYAEGVEYEGASSTGFDPSPFLRSAAKGVEADSRVREVFEALVQDQDTDVEDDSKPDTP